MKARIAVVLLLSSLSAVWASAQVPAGGEFQVPSSALFSWVHGRVASDPGGGFVVAWSSHVPDIPLARGDSGSGRGPLALYGVVGRRYDTSGAPRGPEFQVSSEFNYFLPSVACAAGGAFVFAWEGLQDGSGHGVFVRRYDASGLPRAAAFRVNSYTTGRQSVPLVSSDLAGNFVVAWTSAGQDGDRNGVFAQRYDVAGSPRGPEFRVNTYTPGYQTVSGVASDATGNFVVVWTDSSGQDGSGSGVFAQLYDASGATRGSNFRVNTYTTGGQAGPSVASDRAGNSVVAWVSVGQDGSGWGIFAQRYDAAGTAQGSEFRVNTVTISEQLHPSVASDAAGDFVVGWRGTSYPGYAVFGQRYDASGAPRGSEFMASTPGNLGAPSVASDAAGNFVVVWQKAFGLTAQAIVGQRFGGIQPAALAVDTSASPGSDGNGVLEAGESVDVRPSWRNVNGVAQSFDGTALSFTGPAASGVSYLLQDAVGVYGTVANGATALCSNCYQVGVTFGGTRPSVHWDAQLTERLAPDALGQTIPWSLHVGQSFADVPKTSPYYRDVETLLHEGVTAGCSATAYCPMNPVTREQMAAFVLLAKEGGGYMPPACASPNLFADVPETSLFCDVVEELARRGVVSGCGGGNYCPGAPVSREQMPVFVLRLLDPALDPPACTTPVFADVPASSPFCRWIEELARRGVVGGCSGGNYCPASPVTREQMAVFISGTYGLSLNGP